MKRSDLDYLIYMAIKTRLYKPPHKHTICVAVTQIRSQPVMEYSMKTNRSFAHHFVRSAPSSEEAGNMARDSTVHIFLTKGMLVKVSGPITVQVAHGRIWATQAGRAQDLFLSSGQALRIEAGCEALVEPGENAELAMVQPASRTFSVAGDVVGSAALSLGAALALAWRSVRLRPALAAQLS
jgi:hypothetical protein